MRTPGACCSLLPLLLFLACGPSLGTTSATTGSGTTSDTGGTTTSATGGTSGTSDSPATATTSSGAPTTGMTLGTGSSEPGTSGDASVSSGDCGFVCPPDLPPPSDDCDAWTQNCPEGQKCTAEGGFNDTHCVDIVPDPRGLGEPCSYSDELLSGHDDCGFGLLCWDVDPDTGIGTCHAICQDPDSPTCPDPSNLCWPICQSCIFGICVETCDPRETSCPKGQLCIPDFSADFVCVLDASGDEGQYGDPCEYVNACDPGLFCTDSDLVPGCPPGAGCCSPFCDTDVNDCPDTDLGVTCVPWFDPGQAPAGLEDLGVCALQP